MAYPERGDIAIRILGGADTVASRLGALPPNWSVQPFGPEAVGDYLARLDVFVYFPASTLDEAFGWTVVEAILSGLPVILPPRFAVTFGELALYCEPQDVARVIDNLSADDAGRLRFLDAARREAAARYGTGRLAELRGVPSHAPVLDEDARRFRRQVMSAAAV